MQNLKCETPESVFSKWSIWAVNQDFLPTHFMQIFKSSLEWIDRVNHFNVKSMSTEESILIMK